MSPLRHALNAGHRLWMPCVTLSNCSSTIKTNHLGPDYGRDNPLESRFLYLSRGFHHCRTPSGEYQQVRSPFFLSLHITVAYYHLLGVTDISATQCLVLKTFLSSHSPNSLFPTSALEVVFLPSVCLDYAKTTQTVFGVLVGGGCSVGQERTH